VIDIQPAALNEKGAFQTTDGGTAVVAEGAEGHRIASVAGDEQKIQLEVEILISGDLVLDPVDLPFITVVSLELTEIEAKAHVALTEAVGGLSAAEAEAGKEEVHGFEFLDILVGADQTAIGVMRVRMQVEQRVGRMDGGDIDAEKLDAAILQTDAEIFLEDFEKVLTSVTYNL